MVLEIYHLLRMVVVMKRNKGRLWSESFGAVYNAWGGGGCEAVFLVSGKIEYKGWLRVLAHIGTHD